MPSRNRSNAREGIFCFWTGDIAYWCADHYECSNAREGIFCFWTDRRVWVITEADRVLMPARAFFVFGLFGVVEGWPANVEGSNAREGIFCFWTKKILIAPWMIGYCSNAREGIFCFWTLVAI